MSSKVIVWSFESHKITHKIKKLDKVLKKQGLDPVFITRSQKTQLAFISEGLKALSVRVSDEYVNDFFELGKKVRKNLPSEDDYSSYDKLSGRKITSLPKTSDYYMHQEYFYLGYYAFLFENLKPCLSISLNGLPICALGLSLVSDMYGVPCLFYENGLFPDSLVIDPIGVNYGGSLKGKIDIPKSLNISQNLRQKLEELYATKKTVMGTEHLDSFKVSGTKPNILVALQVDSDSNIKLYSPLVDSAEDFLNTLISSYGLNSEDYNVIVKDHPKRKGAGKDIIGSICETNNFSYCIKADMIKIIESSDLVLCINSTVGLESLMKGKPVVNFGGASYTEKGFTLDFYLEKNNIDGWNIEKMLGKACEIYDKDLLDRFLSLLVERHLFVDIDHIPSLISEYQNITKTIIESRFNTQKLRSLFDLYNKLFLGEARKIKFYVFGAELIEDLKNYKIIKVNTFWRKALIKIARKVNNEKMYLLCIR